MTHLPTLVMYKDGTVDLLNAWALPMEFAFTWMTGEPVLIPSPLVVLN